MASVNPAHEKLLIEGSFRRAIEVYEAEWSADKMNMGPDRAETVRAQIRYANVLHMAGDHEEAVEMYMDVLQKMEFLPPQFDEQALDIKLSLANIYRCDINKAMALLEETENFVARMPLDDAKLPLKRKMAATLRDLGRYESALAGFEEIYRFKCNMDAHNLDALSSHLDIATVYVEQGRYMKAMDVLLSIHREAVSINPSHPCTLKAESCIADICMHHGMTLMACMKYEHVVEVQKADARRSLDTLTSLYKLSVAYLKDGRAKKALEVIESVYNTRITETPWHPDTKRVEIDFMMMLIQEGDIPKALNLVMSALERNSDISEFQYNLTIDVTANIAMFFRRLEETDKAEEAIRIYESLYRRQCHMARLGPRHLESLLTRTNIAETHRYLENDDVALGIFEDVLHIKLNELNNDQMDCLDVRKHIAEIYFKRGEYRKSFDHYREVFRYEKMFLGAYHDVTIATEEIVDNFCVVCPSDDLARAIIKDDLKGVKHYCATPEHADINAQDYFGCTPLHVAVRAGHPKIVLFLLVKGANLFMQNKTEKIPRELAKKTDVKNIFSTVMQLFTDVKKGNKEGIEGVLPFDEEVPLNVLGEDGKTMLHLACEKGDVEMVELLLKKGSDPRVKDASGCSALDAAVKLNKPEMLQTMQKYLEEPNLSDLTIKSPKKDANKDQ